MSRDELRLSIRLCTRWWTSSSQSWLRVRLTQYLGEHSHPAEESHRGECLVQLCSCFCFAHRRRKLFISFFIHSWQPDFSLWFSPSLSLSRVRVYPCSAFTIVPVCLLFGFPCCSPTWSCTIRFSTSIGFFFILCVSRKKKLCKDAWNKKKRKGRVHLDDHDKKEDRSRKTNEAWTKDKSGKKKPLF